MMTRCSLLFVLVACGGPSSSAPASNTTTATPTETVKPTFLNADGTRFSEERVYEGDCMPAGSRGGCHTITLRPDGTYRNFLFDAAIDGTYTITGSIVKLSGDDPAASEGMPLSADGTMLGTLPLKQ